jgi:hypothetical protein
METRIDQTNTVRNRIMEYLVQLYSSRSAGVEGFNITWGKVTRLPVEKNDARNTNVISLMDVNERKTSEIGKDRALLRVLAEFHIPLMEGDIPSVIANQALGDIIRASGLDITCGQLSLNVEEEGNELDTTTHNAKVASGVVVLIITYKHKSNDPTRRM